MLLYRFRRHFWILLAILVADIIIALTVADTLIRWELEQIRGLLDG